MDTSLKQKSIELDAVVQSVLIESQKEYEVIHARITELNTALQEMEKTDLSENADYQKAKDERDIQNALGNMLLRRIQAMSKELEPYVPTGFITLGTTVDLSVIAVDGKAPNFKPTQFIVKVVQHDTSDAEKDLIAVDSKVGAAILGRKAGETVEAETPKGVITYRIERIY